MDVQVLVGIVIVHVEGHIKVDPVQSVHQLAHRIPLQEHIKVGVDAGELAHFLLQGGHSLLHPLRLRQVGGTTVTGVHRIDALAGSAGIDHGVPGDGQGVERLVVGIKGEEQDGIRGAAGHIPPRHQEGIKARLLPAFGHVWQLGPVKFHPVCAHRALVAPSRAGQVGHVRQLDPRPQP